MSNAQHADVADHHIDVLDGLRGFAVLYVMLDHLFPYHVFEHITFLKPLFVVFSMGWSGVDLFFVLSGFLITGILLKHKGSNSYFKAFYGRRILRIFPLYYLLLIAFLIFIPALDLFPGSNNFWTSEGTTWQYWTFMVNLGPATNMAGHAFLSVAWSLAIEEQYYFVWPSVVRFVTKQTVQRICVAGLVGFGLLRVVMYFVFSESPLWLYHFTFTHLDGILLGSLLATLFFEEAKYKIILRRYASSALLLFVVCVVVVSWCALFPNDTQHICYQVPMVMLGYLVVPLFYGSILTRCLLDRGKLHDFFNNSWLRKCGKYSYCMYLIHFILSWFVLNAITTLDFLMFPGKSILFGLSAFGITMVLTYVFASLSWKFFEGPVNGLKKYFPYK